MKKFAGLSSLSLGLSITVFAESASAYGFRGHSRIVEVAAFAMQSGKANPPAPHGVDAGQWSTYTAAIAKAADDLTNLQTGVGNPGREGPCLYDPKDNMARVPFDRIRDMHYLQVRGQQRPGVGTNPAELTLACVPNPLNLNSPICNANAASNTYCSQVPRAPDPSKCPAETDDSNFDDLRLGKVLGWQAAAVDLHDEDFMPWIRPTNSAIVDIASYGPLAVPVVVVGAIVVGIECLWDWITDSGDCGRQFEKAVNLIDDASPAKVIAGDWVPGIDTGRNGDWFTGLWHFVDVADFSGKQDNFSTEEPFQARGMLYEEAGPDGEPGAFDILISLGGGDLGGLGMDPDNSAGVTKYAPFDDEPHSRYDWVSPPLGHVEFSPITSLAQFGYNAFLQNPTTAMNLGYPLHAIGDAAEPHHVAGTSAHGHRPYEDLVDQSVDTGILPPPPSCALRVNGWDSATADKPHQDQMDRILAKGFEFWQGHKGDADFPKSLIQDLARQTYLFAKAAPGDTVYHDGASTLYLVDQDAAVKQYKDSNDDEQLKTMLEFGTGATIAFLTVASTHVIDPGADPKALCNPPTTSYQQIENPDGKNDVWDCLPGLPQPPVVSTGTVELGTPSGLGSGGAGGSGGANCGVLIPCSSNSDCSNSTFNCVAGCCEQIVE